MLYSALTTNTDNDNDDDFGFIYVKSVLSSLSYYICGFKNTRRTNDTKLKISCPKMSLISSTGTTMDPKHSVVAIVATFVVVVFVYLERHISPSIHLSVHLIQLVFT